MFDLDHWYEIALTLRRNAMRTFLTAIGVFWGVFMLVVMVGFGNGLRDGVEGGMMGFATNSIYIWGQRTSLPYDGLAPGRRVELTLEDARAAAQAHPGVDEVAPRVELGGRRGKAGVMRGSKTGTFTVSGDLPAILKVRPMQIAAGRFINPLDVDRERKVAAIGTQVQKELFGDEDPLGKSITIKGIDFTVVGVMKSVQQGDQGDQQAASVFVPITTFQKVLDPSRGINYLSVLSHDDADAAVVEREVLRVLAMRHRIDPGDKQAIGSFNAKQEFAKYSALFQGINVLVFVVGVVTLIAGLIGVSNIMLISVKERTREFGVRKAVGATPWTVVKQVLMESTVLTAISGYLGLIVAILVLEGVGALLAQSGGSQMFAPPSVSTSMALGAAVFIVVGGAFAGLLPSTAAVRIRPTEALRDA